MCIRHLTLHTYVCIVRSLKFTQCTEHILWLAWEGDSRHIWKVLLCLTRPPVAMNADDKPYRVLLIADRQTADCKLGTESRETLAECLSVRPWWRDVLLAHAVCTFYAAIEILPPFVSFVLVTQHPSPHTLLLCLSGPRITEVVSVMVLLASSKCLETLPLWWSTVFSPHHLTVLWSSGWSCA